MGPYQPMYLCRHHTSTLGRAALQGFLALQQRNHGNHAGISAKRDVDIVRGSCLLLPKNERVK
jgi:hypothetical protein